MNKLVLALAGLFVYSHVYAISLDEIPLWTGSGTNRAALVVEWNAPIVLNQTTVPAPVANKTLVWGYRFNGTATGTQMFDAIAASDPRFYTIEHIDPFFGTGIDAIGFNLDGSGLAGVTDGSVMDKANTFTNGILIDPNLNVDAARPLNSNDLFWSGHDGPYWQLWNELGDVGGFANSPNRGSTTYWDPNAYTQGEWSSAYSGLDGLTLTNGSWIGFSVSAAGYPLDTGDTNYSADLAIFNDDEQAPPSPDGTYVAYVCNTNDFAVLAISTNNIYTASPYNNPAAVLGRPTLKFIDYFGTGTTNRAKIIEPPYWTTPQGSDVITEISNGGQITVKLGHKIYDDPNNPYGVDFIVYGNSFFSPSGTSGFVNDGTDLSTATLSSGISGHAAAISVSQDGTNWYTYGTTAVLYPDNAYRWDDTNASWTDEEMNPTKPLNPVIYSNNLAGVTIASGLDQFAGGAGGSGFDLKASGLPWVQYIRIQPGAGTYAVIDAIAAVHPAVVGDALSIAPDNIASGITNLVFQQPDGSGQDLIAINFDFVSDLARVSTVKLNDFSSFTPVTGTVSSAYQVTLKPMDGASTVNFQAALGLQAGKSYAGNGNDLRVYQWNATNWVQQPFTYDPTKRETIISAVTNFSAFVVSQITPPQLSIQSVAGGFTFQFVPVPNCVETLERSADLATWTPVRTFTATNVQLVTLQDASGPAGKAFYRLRLNP